MKKIVLLLAVIGMFSFQGCEGPEGPPGQDGLDGQDGAVPVAFEIKKSFFNDAVDGYIISEPFNAYLDGDLYDNETVLIYRLEGVTDAGLKVWQLIPRTLYLDSGYRLVYDFNFSKGAFTIFAFGDEEALTPQFLNNQIFRIVVSPSNLINSIDKNNFKAVISALNIKENQIQEIKL